MHDIGSPETSVYIYQTTLCHNPQDNTVPLKCVSCTPDDDTEEEMVTSKNKNKTTISTPRLPAWLLFSHTPGLTTLQVLTTVRGSSLLNSVNKQNNAQTPQITEAEWLATWSRNKCWTSECETISPSTIVHSKKLLLLVYFHHNTHFSCWRITEC